MKRIIAVVLILLALVPLFAQEKAVTSLPVTKTNQTQIRTAPSFAATAINGQPVKLESYKGKVILINYWATWCPPCVAEIPELIALQKKYAGKLQIIGISLDDDPADARRFAARTKFNYPVVMANDELKSKYGRILSIPTTIVINKNMMVVQVETGYRNPQFFEELVKRHSK